jgi:DNA recombination protein RmuC
MIVEMLLIAMLAAAAGLCAGVLLGEQRAARRHADLRAELQALSATAVADSSERVFAMADASFKATETVVTPVRDSLDALSRHLEGLQRNEAAWQAELSAQVGSVRSSGEELRAQAAALSEALRRPQVRGQWGEMQLRKALELAGLTRHCTFEEQVPADSPTGAGAIRPDVVVRLTGDRTIVIDSKVPLDAFLSAGAATDAAERAGHLRRHADQVRRHIDGLGAKTYWRGFESSPEFVVLFMPSEALFAQALDTDPTLIDDAARRGVMIATPTTLIAMLKTIAYAWSQESVAENAREIHRVSTELYERLATASNHLDKVGRSLAAAVSSYNAFVGSVETRVLVSARRLHDLDVGSGPPPSLTVVDGGPRPISAPELLPQPADPVVVVGPPGREQWVRPAVGD